jgi:hypothetical protein
MGKCGSIGGQRKEASVSCPKFAPGTSVRTPSAILDILAQYTHFMHVLDIEAWLLSLLHVALLGPFSHTQARRHLMLSAP